MMVGEITVTPTPPQVTQRVLARYYDPVTARAIAFGFSVKGKAIETPISELPARFRPPPVPTPIPTFEPPPPPPAPITIPEQIAIPKMPTDIRVTAPGAIFPGAFPGRPEFRPDIFVARPEETAFERAERKKAREIELAGVFTRRFERPVREKLGTLPTDIGAPGRARLFTEAVLTVGRPLSLVFGPPEIREKTIGFIRDFPEEVIPAATTAGLIIATGAPGLALVAGAPVVKRVRAGKPEEALGIAFGQAAIIGTAALAVKAAVKLRPTGKPLKGAIKPRLKFKKKIKLTEKQLKALLRIKEAEKPAPPRITQVVRRGKDITVTVKAGGKVVDTRRFIEGSTPQSIIDAQLAAAKAQGAKFSGISAPKAIAEIPVRVPRGPAISPFAVSIFDIPVTGAAQRQAAMQKHFERQNQETLRALGLARVTRPTERQREAQAQAFMSAQAQAQAQAQKQAQKQAQRQVQKQSQSQKQAEAQAQSQLQSQAQAQKQSQSEMERTVLGEAAARARPRPRREPRKRAPRVLPLPFLPELPGEFRGRVGIPPRKSGYDAIVKVRGKPRKIARNVSRISALSIGSSFVDARPAASFTIKKTGRVAAGRDIFGWKAKKFKFRPPIRRGKPVKSEIIIEKTKFRIDSPGEVAGIPLAKRLKRMV